MPLDAARDAVIVMQARVIEALAAENTRLAGQVADLAARVERLERQASRNSGNSSMPPSADDLPGRTPPRRKPSAGGKRKPGKQPGSPGSHLAWSEYLDDKVPHFPAGACECGADLAGAGDLGVAASHQQVEIPLVSAQVIQHDLHAVRCDDVLRFAGDLRIPPTSNDAERDLRPAKNPAKDLRQAPLRADHPPAVCDPRLPIHRQQAWHQQAFRPARRPRRLSLDATHPPSPVAPRLPVTPLALPNPGPDHT